jgi:hypothetical protein
MRAICFLLLFAVVATSLTPCVKKTICRQVCDSSTLCEGTCTPKCEALNCRYESANQEATASCQIECNGEDPKCAGGKGCPLCSIVGRDNALCNKVCEELRCTWECLEPKDCPPPSCSLVCDEPMCSDKALSLQRRNGNYWNSSGGPYPPPYPPPNWEYDNGWWFGWVLFALVCLLIIGGILYCALYPYPNYPST